MVRKAHTAPVTAQMYRHFAAVTLAATVAVAMFASGENREAAAAEVAHATAKPVGPKPDATGFVRPRGAAPAGAAPSNGDGFTGTFGQPMERQSGNVNTGFIPGQYDPSTGVPAGYTQYGVSEEVWAALSPDQKKTLAARKKAEQEAAGTQERARQVANLLAASRARSGAETASD
jgi:hypothetical protein